MQKEFNPLKMKESCLKELSSCNNTIENFNLDIANIHQHIEALESLFEIGKKDDEWFQNRIEYYLISEINTHIIVLLIVLVRIFDEHKDSKTLIKKIRYLDKSVKTGKLSKIIEITQDKSRYSQVSKHESSQVCMYFSFIKERYENNQLNFKKKYNTVKSIYKKLGLKEIRDKVIAHNDINNSFISLQYIKLYKDVDFKLLIEEIDALTQELGQIIYFKTYGREIQSHGFSYKEIHQIMVEKIRSDIDKEKRILQKFKEQ